MNEALLQDIYSEIKKIREKLEQLEELIIPVEKISEEELQEIRKLKEESLKGEHIDWNELKWKLGVWSCCSQKGKQGTEKFTKSPFKEVC